MIGLYVVIMMILAFYVGRTTERMSMPLPPPAETPPLLLAGGPYRTRAVELPNTAAPEMAMLARGLREAVQHLESVVAETEATLVEIEREARQLAARSST